MGISERLRGKAAPIWEKEMEHPFVRGIGDGTLPVGRFQYYIKQDYLFLIEYSKVFALAVTKSSDTAVMGKFADLLHAALKVEMELHRGYAERFGIPRSELERVEMAPTTRAYTRHLLHVAETGTLAELMAAILPCQWGYCEIASRLAERGEPAHQPLYVEWIRMYTSPEFKELAEWARGLLDGLAEGLGDEELKKLEEHFVVSSRYEYMFWEMSYTEEIWPV